MGGRGCRERANKKAGTDNKFAVPCPGIARGRDCANNPDTPLDIVPGSSHSRWWHCPLGHKMRQRVAQRVKYGCSKCVLAQSSAQEIEPGLVAQWHDANPKGPHEMTPGSGYRALRIRKHRHVWQAQVRQGSITPGAARVPGRKTVPSSRRHGDQTPPLRLADALRK
ncbi:zinc-ribbon domain-containing protein [Streptomyces sp. NPDC017056]|uniref:zinc-ribbon domain-containing protein n=1 Tax=Streptomyces sp. NPDC017056 TaxID=3364973 RepID=UPI0037BD49C4